MKQNELDELYVKVREGMGIYTGAQDDQIRPAFMGAVLYAIQGGVPESALSSPFCLGVLAKGTNDMWLYREFSSIFNQMVGQLASAWSDTHVEA